MENESELKAISPAAWFHRHKELSGFTNPSRAVYVSLREAVENSLEITESAGIPPRIEIILKAIAAPVKPDEGANGTEEEAKQQKRVYRLTVRDNGPGLERDEIPRAFGQFLVSSHFRVAQARGLFGIGIKAAILYGQSTTTEPAIIESSTDGKEWHRVALEIDITENRAKIMEETSFKQDGTGTSISIMLLGDYVRARSKILEYLEETSMVAPYADISFDGPDEKRRYKPLTDKLPPPPKEAKLHPSGVDAEFLKMLVKESRKGDTLSLLFRKHFQRVGSGAAKKIADAAGMPAAMKASDLTSQQIARIVEVMHNTDFIAPDPSCLSPVSGETLEVGMKRILQPEWLEAVQRKPSAYSGHPFVVTAALAFGGEKMPAGLNLYRFANKIPLLFDEGNDISRVIVNEIDWRRYKVDPAAHRVAIAISIVSTKIPFRSAGKEFIGDVDEVRDEIRLAVQQLARGLMLHISAKERGAAQAKRKSIYDIYIPLALKYLSELSGKRTPKVKK